MDATAEGHVQASIEEARRQFDQSGRPPTGSTVIERMVCEVQEGTRVHPAVWLGSAALVGFALARLLVPSRRRMAEVVEVAARADGGSWLDSAWRAGIDWARPQLAELGKRKLAEFLQKSGTPAQDAGAESPTAMPPTHSAT
jgi:hypothetical protein